jgi:predicted amidophosphoribosyltransferase
MPMTRNMVCFDCRRSVSQSKTCPECKQPTVNMGMTPIPRRTQRNGWKKLRAKLAEWQRWHRILAEREARKHLPPLGRPIYQYQCEIEVS